MEDPFKSADPLVLELYASLLSLLKSLGPFRIEAKKISVHFVNRAAFLGAHPGKTYLDINIVYSAPLSTDRGYKVEQVSKNRYHNRKRIRQKSDLNQELIRDIKHAYKLLA
jgi:hypothetical protein